MKVTVQRINTNGSQLAVHSLESSCGHHAVLSAPNSQWSFVPAVNHYDMLQKLIIHFEQK